MFKLFSNGPPHPAIFIVFRLIRPESTGTQRFVVRDNHQPGVANHRLKNAGMEVFKAIVDTASLVASFFTVVASGIAIYVFFAKGPELRTAFSLLLNWSFQLTLTELKSKLERLNEYNANEPTDVEEIRNILHEIAGQIRGNRRVNAASQEIAIRLEQLARSKGLTEPKKRSMVAELREILRNIEVNTLAAQSEDNHV